MINSPLLEKNISILQTFQPLLAKELIEFRKKIELCGGFSITEKEGPNGIWVSAKEEAPFFQGKVSENSYGKKHHEGECVFVVNGIGAPPYLFHLLRKLPKTALAVVVVEPSMERLLYTLSLTSVYTALPDGCRISFVVSEDQFLSQEALSVNIKPLGIFLVNSAIKINHRGELESLDERFLRLERELWRQIRLSVEYLGNTAEDTLIGVRNIALNTPWVLNSPRFCDFFDFYGRPCVCVASGPSLDKNVHLLRDVQDKFIIISADTAAKKLISLGIIPHFITSIERPQEMYVRNIAPLIETYPEECSRIVLIAAFVCTPQTVARWPGPVKIVGKSELDLDKWLIGALLGGELFPCGASVAHMAVSVAVNLKASSIALIGQDLAYGEEGRSHALDTASEEDQASEAARYENLLEVPGVDGNPVKTHVTWLKFIKIFESFVKRCEGTGTTIHDCTQGGALISGTVVEDLSCFIEKHATEIEPFKKPPYAVILDRLKDSDVVKISKNVQEGLYKSGHPMVQVSMDLLESIEKHIDALSETLLPSQRREHGRKAAELLDRLHQGNSPLAFIGQSYTYLSGSIIAETRELETMDQVYRFKKAYGEIIDGHRLILKFFTQWFFYIAKAAYWYGENPDNREELLLHRSVEDLIDVLSVFLDDLVALVESDQEEDGSEIVKLNVLLAKIDEKLLPKDERSAEILWRLALMLSEQGRGERASRVILAAASLMEGVSLEKSKIVAFLEDMVNVLINPDLTHVPPFRLALSVARNLGRYGEKDRSEALVEKVKRAWHEYLDNLRTSKVIQEKKPIEYFRLLGDLALLEGDFGAALKNVWSLVFKAYEARDGRGEAPLQWLCRYLDVALKAEEDDYRDAGNSVLSEIIDFPEVLGYFHPKISPYLFSCMNKKGLKLESLVSDKETREGGGDVG